MDYVCPADLSLVKYSLCCLVQILEMYFPILQDTVEGLLEWPNFAIATAGLCIIVRGVATPHAAVE